MGQVEQIRILDNISVGDDCDVTDDAQIGNDDKIVISIKNKFGVSNLLRDISAFEDLNAKVCNRCNIFYILSRKL